MGTEECLFVLEIKWDLSSVAEQETVPLRTLVEEEGWEALRVWEQPFSRC